MGYDPRVHHRRSIRLKGYDYSQPGYYFVTICTWRRIWFFSEYPALREIVARQWLALQERFPSIALDEFVIMPNHVHGIIGMGMNIQPQIIGDDENTQTIGAGLAPAPIVPPCNPITDGNVEDPTHAAPITPKCKPPTVGDVVGAFKSLCVVEWLRFIKSNQIETMGKFWHRNYYEHIIRDNTRLNRIREYIRLNPFRWKKDAEYR